MNETSSPKDLTPRRRKAVRTAKEHGPDPVDVHVGARVRLRRTLLRMSQEQLADAAQVSFQQIQKYERGTNRISASRLYDIARALGVTISFFFEDMDEDSQTARPTASLPDTVTAIVGEPPRYERDEMSRTQTLRLIRAFWSLGDEDVRDRVLDLVESLRKRG